MQEEHDPIEKIQDGEATCALHERLSSLPDDDIDDDMQEILTPEYLESLRDATPFIDGINKRLAELGVDPDADPKEKVNFILSKCKEHGIPTDSSTSTAFLSKPTLKNWLTSSPPTDRKNVFLLCFALEMNLAQCAEFFLKSFLSRPFNYKDTTEAVYFHSFDHGKPYTKAIDILKRIESSPKQDINPDKQDVATITVGKTISEITDEDMLVSYLLENQFDTKKQHVTIRKEIENLLEEDKELAAYIKEKEREWDGLDIDAESESNLIDYIFGFKAEDCQNIGAFSKYLPPLLGNNLLTRQNLLKIQKGTTTNDDMYRKALVLLYFFKFYATLLKEQYEAHKSIADIDLLNFDSEKHDEVYYEEFKYKLDTILDACGYLQLYARHPMDWIILYCARHRNPLQAWKDFIENYYLTPAEEAGCFQVEPDNKQN